jgi:hypothetical protein
LEQGQPGAAAGATGTPKDSAPTGQPASQQGGAAATTGGQQQLLLRLGQSLPKSPGRSQQLSQQLLLLMQPETRPRPASAAHFARRKRFMC